MEATVKEIREKDYIVESSPTVTGHHNMKTVYQQKSLVYKGAKRFMDITLSLCALAALSPVFLLTAIAIKLEDGGAVFFIQPRAGKDMKTFKMWKFRSMYMNADEKLKEALKCLQRMSRPDMPLK